jgi:hypothetical protein
MATIAADPDAVGGFSPMFVRLRERTLGARR